MDCLWCGKFLDHPNYCGYNVLVDDLGYYFILCKKCFNKLDKIKDLIVLSNNGGLDSFGINYVLY